MMEDVVSKLVRENQSAVMPRGVRSMEVERRACVCASGSGDLGECHVRSLLFGVVGEAKNRVTLWSLIQDSHYVERVRERERHAR